MELVCFLFTLTLLSVSVVGLWKVFGKAGESGWASLVPIYNFLVLLRIGGRPWWWLLLCCLPLLGIFFAIPAMIDVARKFGKGTGFGIGLTFLPFIFFTILGFGEAEYLGRPAVRKPSRSAGEDEEDEDYEDEEMGPAKARRDAGADEDDEDFVDVEVVSPAKKPRGAAEEEVEFVEMEEVPPPPKGRPTAEEEEDFIDAEVVAPPSDSRPAAPDDADFIEAEEVPSPSKKRPAAAAPEDSFIEAEEVPAPKKRSRPIFDEDDATGPPTAPPGTKSSPPAPPAEKPVGPSVVRCTQCKRALRVPEALLGKRVKCPGCGAGFVAG